MSSKNGDENKNGKNADNNGKKCVKDKILGYLETVRVIKSKAEYKKAGCSAKGFIQALNKLVKENVLVSIKVPGDLSSWYFVNASSFYEPEELFSLIPDSVRDKILKPLETGEVRSVKNLASNFFKDSKTGLEFLETLIYYFVGKKLITKGADGFKKTRMGREFGIDVQSMISLKNDELEGQLALKRKVAFMEKYGSLEDVEKALREENEKKVIRPIDLTQSVKNGHFTLAFLTEIMFGNKFSDVELLRWVLERIHPDVTIASGLIQGNYLGEKIDKNRVLAWGAGLNEIDVQFKAAALLSKELEKVTRLKVFEVQGDDDWDLAKGYAKLAHLAEGKIFSYGYSNLDLAFELRRRLDMLSFYRKWKIQYEIILPYQYRIGRSLLNCDEVYDKIGIYKSEKRLIMEILLALENNIGYPETYNKVVNVKALLDHGTDSKRIVTPNSLLLKVGDKIIQFVHNPAFSNITQYLNTLDGLIKVMRNLGARKHEDVPWLVAEGHQEQFYATFIPSGKKDRNDDGHWIMNLPGLQNPIRQAQYQLPEFETRVLSSKSHRQVTFRKRPVSPGVVTLTPFVDGRLRFNFYNHSVKRVIEDSKNLPEETRKVCILNDIQVGSITMRPEALLKFLDYCLFEVGVDIVIINGDGIQGFNYQQMPSENRPYRLVSVDSQQRFFKDTILRLIPEGPKVKKVISLLGNHEWNTFGAQLTGPNLLNFIEFYLNGIIDGMKTAGHKCSLEKAASVSRIRIASVERPDGGAIINWPYYAEEFAGFKMAISHQFERFGAGTPVDGQIKWLHNMADSAADTDVMVGGDKHSVWMAQVADKLLIRTGAAAHQSGYELNTGLRSTVMFTVITFSNRTGITVEMVPMKFTDQYVCKSNFLKGKDKELVRPRPGTPEYFQGKMSPFIERIIDDITYYTVV